MPRIQDAEKGHSQDYHFIFKPQKDDCYYQESIKAKFCIESSKNGAHQYKKCYEGPVFNKDRASTTPAFIMKSEKEKFKLSVALINNQNPQKYFNACSQKSELLVPKPSSKSFYCNVCKQKYEDYKQHIQTDKHKGKIQSNQFNKHILKMAARYSKNRLRRQKIKETNQATLSQFSNLIVIDEDSQINQASKPKKKVKQDTQYTQTRTQLPENLGMGFPGYYQPSPINSIPYYHIPYLNQYQLSFPFCPAPNLFPFLNILPALSGNIGHDPLSWVFNSLGNCGYGALGQPEFQFQTQQCKNQCIVIQDDNI